MCVCCLVEDEESVTRPSTAASDVGQIDVEHMRGKKLLRLARRVSGLLMQLTVFEIPTPIHFVRAAAAAKGKCG